MQGIEGSPGASEPAARFFSWPQAWTEQDFSGPSEWIVPLPEPTRQELKAAIAYAQRRAGEASIGSRADFPLPSFGPLVDDLRRRLRDGAGFVVLRGLDLPALTEEEARIAYAGLGSHLGVIVPQNLRGERLYSVRDEGIRPDVEYGRTGVRFSKSNLAFDFHTDSPSRVAGITPDFIGLLVLRAAKSGGDSVLVNGYALHNILRAERPDVLQRLYRPFWVDRRAELPPGEEPVLPVAVFAFNGRLTLRYLRFYINKGQEWKGEPLNQSDLEALDFFEGVMHRPGVAVRIPMEPGDIQWISNTVLLHSRTGYEDYAEPERKRHYIRLWLADRAS